MEGLDQYGGLEGITKWAEYLSNNSEFADFVKAQQDALNQPEGQQSQEDLSQYDEDTRKALELVDQRAQAIADQRLAEAMAQRVDPIANKYKEENLQASISKMDETYGEDWHEARDTMAKLANELPAELQDNPNFEALDDLFWKAMRIDGKRDDFAAKLYSKKLEKAKSHSTERPASTAGLAAPKKANTVAEAFAMAKASHN